MAKPFELLWRICPETFLPIALRSCIYMACSKAKVHPLPPLSDSGGDYCGRGRQRRRQASVCSSAAPAAGTRVSRGSGIHHPKAITGSAVSC
eukprot:scaffold129783_cov20-Prasinocladus_malaysianus.AAC.1